MLCLFCNLLFWSFFTFIYHRSSHMNYFIIIYFTPFHCSREIWTQQIDLAPNVWLHSSVGRALHRYRGGNGFESRWSSHWFFQASSFQLPKLENLLQWSFFTFIYNYTYWISEFGVRLKTCWIPRKTICQ